MPVEIVVTVLSLRGSPKTRDLFFEQSRGPSEVPRAHGEDVDMSTYEQHKDDGRILLTYY